MHAAKSGKSKAGESSGEMTGREWREWSSWMGGRGGSNPALHALCQVYISIVYCIAI